MARRIALVTQRCQIGTRFDVHRLCLGEWTQMDLMTRLQQAAAQTWWLPPSASIYEDDECSYYEHGGSYRVVRFSPHPKRQDACLRTICERAGAAPLSFDYFRISMGPIWQTD